MTNRCAGVYAFTRRARVRPKPRLYSEFLKSGAGGRNLEISPGRGPHEVAAERYLSQLCRNKPVASVPLNRDRRDVLRLWRTSDLCVLEGPLSVRAQPMSQNDSRIFISFIR